MSKTIQFEIYTSQGYKVSVEVPSGSIQVENFDDNTTKPLTYYDTKEVFGSSFVGQTQANQVR